MKIVLFWYGDVLRDQYWGQEDYIFFDQSGWWIFGDNRRELCSVDEHDDANATSYPEFFDIVNVIAELRSLGPLWSRWCGRGDQYELLLREAALRVLQISRSLTTFGTGVAIFSTGVSHHIDSSICELACRLVGWKQVFFYPSIFSNRLIPLIQKDSISDRHIVSGHISDFSHDEVIIEFRDRWQAGLLPKVNYEINAFETSFLVAFGYLLATSLPLYLKSRFGQLLRRTLDSVRGTGKMRPDIFQVFYSTYPFQYLSQMLVQKKALEYYQSRALNQLPSADGSNKLRLILVAHLQPEAATFPEGGLFGDHIDIVVKLRQMKYTGPILYKDHPGTRLYLAHWQPKAVGMHRSIRYFQQLENLGCQFLSTTVTLSKLGTNVDAYLPITITVERSLAGLHTIVVGVPWYKGLPGVIPLSSLDSLNSLPIEWTRPDATIARKAFEFLANMLNGHTITNTPGIGTGTPLTDVDSREKFIAEFEQLARGLRLGCA
jgi:hypothetical protein